MTEGSGAALTVSSSSFHRRDERPPEHAVLRPHQPSARHHAGAQRHRVRARSSPRRRPSAAESFRFLSQWNEFWSKRWSDQIWPLILSETTDRTPFSMMLGGKKWSIIVNILYSEKQEADFCQRLKNPRESELFGEIKNPQLQPGSFKIQNLRE